MADEPDATNVRIGARVERELRRAGLTNRQLAVALGVDPGAVTKRLSGRTPWKVSDVEAAAELLGVEVSDLMAPSDQPTT